MKFYDSNLFEIDAKYNKKNLNTHQLDEQE
jgi:hypothetical protein